MKLVFTGDWHTRRTIPICRKDGFLKVQIETLKQIAKIARDNNAVILHSGDIFHKAISTPELEILLADIFKNILIHFIPGNHDLLAHHIMNFGKSSVGVLDKYENWVCVRETQDPLIRFFPYGVGIIDRDHEEELFICVMHKYCEEDNLPDYIQDGITAKLLLERYSYDIFVIGDNHRSFVYEKGNRIVFNTGCITRQSVTEKDYKPSVILFDTEIRKYEIIYLLDNDPDVISSEHIVKITEKNARIDSFIDKMRDGNIQLELSFEKNLDNFMGKNKTDKYVKDMVHRSLQEE